MREEGKRYNWVGAPEIFSLEHCCHFVSEAFGGDMCYLVGSATERRDFRDVDIRMIMGDLKFKTLFGDHKNGSVMMFWSLICTSISEYLQKRTGLKVDFQIQSMSMANTDETEGKIRNPCGLYLGGNTLPAWSNIGLLDSDTTAQQARGNDE